MKKHWIVLTLLFICLSYCKNASHSHEDHDSEHEETKIQITAYSSEYELFAEADPFVEGQPASVLSHFTSLNNFKPLLKGKVTLSLTVNGNTVSGEELNPIRPGIYLFSLVPKNSGKGRMVFTIENNGVNSNQIVIDNIVVYKSETEADEAKHEAPSSALAIPFTKEKSWKVDFATALPEYGTFGQIIKTTAQVQSAQGDEVILTAKTNGLVSFPDKDVVEGKNFSSGQRIFSISDGGITDNNFSVRMAEADNNYKRAKADYERALDLAKDKIVSEKELLKTKNEFDNAKAVFDNLNKNFKSSGQMGSSPFNGFIKQVFVRNGEYVNAGQPIVTVSQNRSLLLRADVSQKYASVLSSVASATIRTIHNNQTYTLNQLNGKFLSYGRNTNSDNYLIPVSIQVDNRGDLFPGVFVELFLKAVTQASSMSLPNSALMEDQGNFYVFVQLNPELFEKREVKIGSTDGLSTEILSGIDKSERIVTKGAIWVKLAQSSGALDAHSGHNH